MPRPALSLVHKAPRPAVLSTPAATPAASPALAPASTAAAPAPVFAAAPQPAPAPMPAPAPAMSQMVTAAPAAAEAIRLREERAAMIEPPAARMLGERREEPAMTFGRQPATAAVATERAAVAEAAAPEPRVAERPTASLRVDPPMTPPARTASEAAKQAQPAEKRRAPNLFARVTGGAAAWARNTTPEKKEAAPAARPTAAPPAVQARLSGLDPQDSLASTKTEEDLLDIPAFLRRQAN